MSDSINLNKLHPIDFHEVLGRIGGDTSFLLELLNIYFQEYSKKKQLLDEAITRQDFTQGEPCSYLYPSLRVSIAR